MQSPHTRPTLARKRRKGLKMLTELGKYLRTYRIQNGVTADEMADAAGVKKGALLKAETGSGRLTVKNLDKNMFIVIRNGNLINNTLFWCAIDNRCVMVFYHFR